MTAMKSAVNAIKSAIIAIMAALLLLQSPAPRGVLEIRNSRSHRNACSLCCIESCSLCCIESTSSQRRVLLLALL